MRAERAPDEQALRATLADAGRTLIGRRRLLGALAGGGVAALLPPLAGGAGAQQPGSPLDQLLARRRMVRRFTDADVTDAQITRLLNAARRAPSAGHTQPWVFVVVRDPQTRALLGRAAVGQTFVAEAPVSIVACADVSRSRKRYKTRGALYSVIDTAFAAMLLLLAVTEEGLGACFVGALKEDDVRDALALPAHVRPIAVIPIGHPVKRRRPTELRPLDDMVYDERWGNPRAPTR